MADEPSNGELARRLDEVLRRLGELVSRYEYTTDQKHTERRFGEIERDVETLRQRFEQQTTQSGSNIRQAIYSGLIPGVVFLLTILLALKGGGA